MAALAREDQVVDGRSQRFQQLGVFDQIQELGVFGQVQEQEQEQDTPDAPGRSEVAPVSHWATYFWGQHKASACVQALASFGQHDPSASQHEMAQLPCRW